MSQTMEQTDTNSLRDGDHDKTQQKSRRPPNNAFRQQRLKAWQPILTPKTVLPLFFAIGVIFAPLGGVLLWASSTVQEISLDYSRCSTDAPVCDGALGGFEPMPSNSSTAHFKNKTSSNNIPQWCRNTTNVPYGTNDDNNNYTVPTSVCRIMYYIPDDIQPPVLLYYRLTNFYQNHRRYVQSYDQDQLSGQARDNSSIQGSNCDPLQLETLANNTQKAFYPCGLIANSLFNDTFHPPVLNGPASPNVPQGQVYNMTNSSIAWAADADLYGQTDYNFDQVVPPVNWRLQYPAYNSTFPFPRLDEWQEFQVWMRTAGLPTFSKLALRNDQEVMQAGSYIIDVYDYFPVTLYDGTKSILISTRTVMGGRNPFLGIAYIVIGGVCILLGGLFTATQLIRPRKLGDHSYLSWNSDQPTTATTTGRAPRPNEP